MAIMTVTSCLGPPPLPPGKRFLQRSSKKLSSTYLSFRDPAIESWIPMVQEIPRYAMIKPLPSRPKSRASYSTHHERDFSLPRTNLFRSQSDGNLFAKKSHNVTLTPLDKCIKVIYGSWKNLMQRKF